MKDLRRHIDCRRARRKSLVDERRLRYRAEATRRDTMTKKARSHSDQWRDRMRYACGPARWRDVDRGSKNSQPWSIRARMSMGMRGRTLTGYTYLCAQKTVREVGDRDVTSDSLKIVHIYAKFSSKCHSVVPGDLVREYAR